MKLTDFLFLKVKYGPYYSEWTLLGEPCDMISTIGNNFASSDSYVIYCKLYSSSVLSFMLHTLLSQNFPHSLLKL